MAEYYFITYIRRILPLADTPVSSSLESLWITMLWIFAHKYLHGSLNFELYLFVLLSVITQL